MKYFSLRRKYKNTIIITLCIVIYWKIFLKELFVGPIDDIKTSSINVVAVEEVLEEDYQEGNYIPTEKESIANDKDELSSLPGSQYDLSNIYNPDEYDASGCPIVPIAFSGMVGRLGNVMCTYSNFIALQWKLGFKYFLPKYMNHHSGKDATKPYFQSVFKNVTFPTATWTNITDLARNAEKDDLVMFNNSRTNYEEVTCNKEFHKIEHLQPTISEQLKCANKNNCSGRNCLSCKGSCMCNNIWVTQAGGANYLDLEFVEDVLEDIIKYHLQFRDEVVVAAVNVIDNVARNISGDENTRYVGVHVRRGDFETYSKFWMKTLLDERFFEAAMDHFRQKYSNIAFLVMSDDMDWCRAHLTSPDTYHVGTPSPEVDMVVMANCNDSIIDYGTFGMWGAIMAGGETVTSKQTFRDVQIAADHFGWTYV